MSYEAGSAIDSVAVFPLPGVVLFPGAPLPLHIFEPRYRKMTEDALAGSRRLCVVHVPDPKALDDAGNPRVCEVSGLGEIVEHVRLPDGRFELLLVGRARVQLAELPFDPPYRRARATVLDSRTNGDTARDLSALMAVATRFLGAVKRSGQTIELELPDTREPALLADACAHLLIMDGAERQAVLEALDVSERLRLCMEAIAVQELLLAPPTDSN